MTKLVQVQDVIYSVYRASGQCICDCCGKEYWRHKMDKDIIGLHGSPFLHVLCNGDRVKL